LLCSILKGVTLFITQTFGIDTSFFSGRRCTSRKFSFREICYQQGSYFYINCDLWFLKPMLHKTIFNDNSQRNGLLNQSYLVQLHLNCESSLKIIPCNISFIGNAGTFAFFFTPKWFRCFQGGVVNDISL
jgi:hypothetical protein